MNTNIQHRDAQKASAENVCAAFRENSAVMDLTWQDVLNGALIAERIIKLAKIFNNHKQKKLEMCRSSKSCGKYNYYWFPYTVPTGNKRATIIIWRNIR